MGITSNNGLIKTYDAKGAISAYRIVKVGAADIDASSGERVDVIHSGIASLKLGGTVARGGPMTSDASVQGVSAAPSAGTNNRTIRFALISGALGDIVPVLAAPGQLQG